METIIINIKSKKDKTLFYALAERLNLKTTTLSEDDKEDYSLLKKMIRGRKDDFVTRDTVMKELRK